MSENPCAIRSAERARIHGPMPPGFEEEPAPLPFLATLLIATVVAGASASGAHAPAWRALGPGFEYALVPLPGASGSSATLHVVRVDPARARVRAEMASRLDGHSRTAGEWCRKRGLAVAINLGMFSGDGRAHLGYLRSAGREVESTWRDDYRSAVGLAPPPGGPSALRWVDLDRPGARESLRDYGLVVQNLRIVRGDRRIVWAVQPRRWSEAALAADGPGRLLLLFCREALPMAEFARRLLAAPLDVRGVMHVEGGPEASLSIHAGGLDLDLCGSYETGFREDDTNTGQWPIPNVLGVETPR